MQIDLAHASVRQEPALATMQVEVCIVGGGIAGLLLATRLAAQGVEVALLEAGGSAPLAAEDIAATDAQQTGAPYSGAWEGPVRALGGSSLVWGGQLLPAKELAGWPVALAELEPFYGEVEGLLGVDDASYEANAFLKGRSEPLSEWPGDREDLALRMSKFAPFRKRNLGASLGRSLLAHHSARVLLHAQVTAVQMNEACNHAEAVIIQLRSGEQVRIGAKHIVVAAGTVETCRLLLASGEGRLRACGQVGVNFHDHLTLEIAEFRGVARQRAVALLQPWLVGGLRGTAHVAKMEATEALQRELRCNPALAHVTFQEPETSGVGRLRQLLLARQRSGRTFGWKGLLRAGLDAARLQWTAWRKRRRYISPRAKVALRINLAQAMPSRSRVRLGGKRDEGAQGQAVVEWHHAPEDLRSLRSFASYLQQAFTRAGFGEEQGVIWRRDVLAVQSLALLPGLDDARHAMGGACMGTDPNGSVVDPQLRVHGVQNLWVASAAVFPDGQPQLPTLTLMALTLRLADQLQRVLGR